MISRPVAERAAWPHVGVPARILSNGSYGVLLSPTGTGMSALDGFALTRWTADPVRDADGTFLYLRDLDSGIFWAATHRPVSTRAAAESVHSASGVVRYDRTYCDIETSLEVTVAPASNVELRRLTIGNAGATTRRIEITTCAGVVLNTVAADIAHPAFSRLFVQTGYDPARRALLAWRRLRSPHDRPLWFGHRLIGGNEESESWETDRRRFIGRGRAAAAPRALLGDRSLSGTVGNVLDPVFALRRIVELEPGAAATITAVYSAADDRIGLERQIDAVAGPAAVASLFAAAASAAAPSAPGAPGDDTEKTRALPEAVRVLGLPAAWLDNVALDADWTLTRSSADAHTDAVPDPRPESSLPDAPELRLFNGYGGFSPDGDEYIVRVSCDEDGARLPPLPWINVIANEDAGCLVSERGAVCTWTANSRENRITPWFNDPVTDPHGEAFYLRDDESGYFHSLTPGPAPAHGSYDVQHGFGYTRFVFENDAVAHELTIFMARADPLRIARVTLTNRSDRSRTLSVYAYAQLVLGGDPAATRYRIETGQDEATGALLARNRDRAEFSGRVAFAAPVSADGVHHVSADRRAFLGRDGDAAHPAAFELPALDGTVGVGLDACAALQITLRLAPGETARCAFLLGEAEEAGAARALVHRYADEDAVDDALVDARAYWRELLGGVVVETPVPELDLVVNGWLTYQNLSCRMWGRSALYQSGGAFGFRDQLQDAAALVYLDPALTRRQIVLHAEHQFLEGDVLHWWHPPLSKGLRTRFSDDLLWLPYIAAFYVGATGDASVFDEQARFLTAPALESDEDEVFLVPADAGASATVFEHCCRSIDRSLTRGVHGLPLIGVGDWNDGMNRVGREGRGESVWLGFFLYDILHDFIPLCARRGEEERAELYRQYQRDLEKALNDGGWDGAWYRRAYYDDGAPLGAAQNEECRIDTIAQAWAVLSGAASGERAQLALDATEAHLVAEDDGIIRLLTPAFDRTPHDPGYIRGYLPGVRENGGQYTHGALWAVRALAQAGRRERAARLLTMLSPVSHGRTPQEIAQYQAEPYVVAADVYGVAPHVGRGGWTWYTGSAGWMFRVALESVLGFQLSNGEEILLRPCIPASWPAFRIHHRLPDGVTTFTIYVTQSGAASETDATLDGAGLAIRDGAVVIPLVRDGGRHEVRIRLGDDVGPGYLPRPA